MFWAYVDVSIICNTCRPSIDHLETPTKLAPECIFSSEKFGSKVPRGKVVHECVVCMPTFELSLPNMMMRINEAWTDYLVGAVDNLSLGR